MTEVLRVVPDREIIEWYLSGRSGGRDGRGVAVTFNWETGLLEPDKNFANRAEQWRVQCPGGVDQYTLVEMPDLRLLADYIAHRGVMFNLETRRLERTMMRAPLLV